MKPPSVDELKIRLKKRSTERDDKINMLRDFGAGQEVEVAFNISSREFNGKYYHNIDAWKITSAGAAATS